MISNELRIGNWIEIKDSKGICTRVTESTFDSNIEKNYKPVPLTEQWLLNFGFESDGLEWWNGVIMLGVYKDGLYYCPTEELSYRLAKEFKYVHQLQNLHHALTDSELIIK